MLCNVRCSERVYAACKFKNRVAYYPFDDHSAPPLMLIEAFCQDVVSGLILNIVLIARQLFYELCIKIFVPLQEFLLHGELSSPIYLIIHTYCTPGLLKLFLPVKCVYVCLCVLHLINKFQFLHMTLAINFMDEHGLGNNTCCECLTMKTLQQQLRGI